MVLKKESAGRMRLLDMHAHLSCFMEKNGQEPGEEESHALAMQELTQRKEYNISTFFSCGTLEEWNFMQAYRDRDELFFSFGIHPWYSGRSRAEDGADGNHILYGKQRRDEALWRAFEECDAVGEIGMDSVWCDVPLAIQRSSFEEQLQIAADLKKPVILHTKGMESEIAAMIQDFPEPVCVHWYSGDLKNFEAFLKADCYFTLGPDLADVCGGRIAAGERGKATDAVQTVLAGGDAVDGKRELYRTMLPEIPVNRLFVETDGISSIAWARGTQEAEFSEIPQVLARNMELTAEIKNMQRDELYGRMWENLGEFFRRSGKKI